MVVPAKYTGRLVLMTALSMAMAALALSEPWYSAELSEESAYGDMTLQKDTFYIDYYRVHPVTYSEVYKYPSDSQIKDVMSWERIIILAWLLIGLVFIGACLVDFKELSVGSSIILLVIGILAVVFFVGRLTHALDYDSSTGYFGLNYYDIPFIGSREVDSGRTVSGMPGLGFWFVFIATLIQVTVGVVKTKIEVFDRKSKPAPQ